MAKKKVSKKKASRWSRREEDAPEESEEEASDVTEDSESAPEPVTDLESETESASPAPTATSDLPEAPTLDQVKEFVAGGGTLPPNLIAAEHNVSGGRMVKLKGLAQGHGHPKIIIPS